MPRLAGTGQRAGLGGGQTSGVVAVSGAVHIESGLVAVLSGSIDAWVSGTVAVSGQVAVLSGRIAVLSGSIGAQVSGNVYVSGHVEVISGIITIDGGDVGISGTVTVESGAHIEEVGVVHSGHIHILSGQVIAKVSGEVVDIATPTSILMGNWSGNYHIVTAASGGNPLLSGAIVSVTVKALSDNSGDVWIAGHTADHRPTSGHGLLLEPGEAINLDVDNFGKVKTCAEVSGDLVCYIGIT